MNWLITGGAGFIGSRLVHQLWKAGDASIRIVDNLTSGLCGSRGSRDRFATIGRGQLRRSCGSVAYRELAPPDLAGPPEGIELVVADIADADLALRAAEGAEVIVHLAANSGIQPSIADPRLDCTTNVVGTLNYLEAARLQAVPRFIFASSSAVIGDITPPIHEEMVPCPKSPYGASKSACEGYLSAYQGSFGIDTVALRFANVYGPGSSHKEGVVARFILRALAGESLEIYGDGSWSRNFIYVDDLVRAVVKAAHTPGVGGEVFQIASGRETSIGELATLLPPLLEAAGISGVEVSYTDPLPGEIRRSYSDCSKAERLLDWRAEVDLVEGLKRTLDWYLEQTRSKNAQRRTLRVYGPDDTVLVRL